MLRLFIFLLVLVICAIAITRRSNKTDSHAEPKSDNQNSYKTRNRTCIIFILELWVLTAFFAFVPVSRMSWVSGMVFALINAFAYLVLWVFMFRHREKRIDDIFMLFIPIYCFTGTSIAAEGLKINNVIAVIISLIPVILTVLSLLQKPEQHRFRIKNTYLIIMAATAVIFSTACLILNDWYHAHYASVSGTQTAQILKHNPLYLLALLLIMFFVFLLLGREKSRQTS